MKEHMKEIEIQPVLPANVTLSLRLMYMCFCLISFQNTVTMIAAHDSPLAALSFNATATQLASASERVRTVIFLSFLPVTVKLYSL